MSSPLGSYVRGYYDQAYFPGLGRPPLPPAPVISSLVPPSAVAGSGPLPVTVNGSDFNATSVVDVAGAEVPTVFVSVSELTATVTPLATAGTLLIRVRNVDTGTQSGTSLFTVTAAPPLVPNIGATQPPDFVAGAAPALVAVAGTNFIASSVVDADGVEMPTIFRSAIRLDVTFTPPAVPGTVQLRVRNVATGTQSADFPFTITALTTRSDGPVPGAAAGTMPAADGGTKKRRAT